MPKTGPKRRRHVSTVAEESDDLALVERIKAGEKAAWDELLARHADRMFNLCLRMVGSREFAADLAQDAMVKVIEGIGTYDGRARLSTWIHRVTTNVVISKLRAEKHRRHASLEAGPSGNHEQAPSSLRQSLTTREPAPESNVEVQQQRRRVTAALLKLSPDQRAIIVLRDSQGLDYEQIGDVLGIGVGTVKSRLFRARAALRDAIENEPEH
jgi:RNA polymerase sigma-70 factor (ECF subfamily)